MIRIHVNWTESRFEAQGHANWAEPGKDIVCAAVSILTQTMLKSLEEAEEREEIGTVKAEMEKGMLRIRVKNEGINNGYWPKRRTSRIMEFAMTGLRMIRERYPERIEIEEE